MALTLQLNPFVEDDIIQYRDKIYASKIDLTTPDALNYPTSVLAGDSEEKPGFVNLLEITSDLPGELDRCTGRPFTFSASGLQILPIGSTLVPSGNNSLYLWFLARKRFGRATTAIAASNLVIIISTEDEEPIPATLPSVPVVSSGP